jgi:hypothetical protein
MAKLIAWKSVLRNDQLATGVCQEQERCIVCACGGCFAWNRRVFGCISFRLIAKSSSLLYAQFARLTEYQKCDDLMALTLEAAWIKKNAGDSPLVHRPLCTGARGSTRRIEIAEDRVCDQCRRIVN